MFDFEIKIAEDKKEIQQAQILRYDIFRREIAQDLEAREKLELDTDIYDKFSDHLIIIDKSVGKIVGTYRLILGSRVDENVGFYTENFFDIRNIKKLAKDDEILELGRSCVHRDYRSGLVINLLWNGIARYITERDIRYLFGAPRLCGIQSQEVNTLFKFIKEKFYAPLKFRVYPKPEKRFQFLKPDVPQPNFREFWRQLPPLVKGYLKAGVLVCGLPAIDPDLDSVLIFILLDIQRLPASYRQHFF